MLTISRKKVILITKHVTCIPVSIKHTTLIAVEFCKYGYDGFVVLSDVDTIKYQMCLLSLPE